MEPKQEVFREHLEELFNKVTRSSIIYESTIHVEDGSGNFIWNHGYGGRTIDSPMNLASVTKLFTTTCIINLIEQEKLSLKDNLSKYFGPEVLEGIHIYKGKDYSYDLTIENLLFQNSGLPDVYYVGRDDLTKQELREDRDISFQEYIKIAKENKKKFPPGAKGKAHYSDLNFEMLGKIIEQVEGTTLHEAFKKYVFEPLDLKNTYLMERESDICANLYNKHEPLQRPKFWRSIPASGGCVSTSRETMIFIKAFFNGQLFDKSIFKELRKFNTFQYCPPLSQYGGGFIRLNIAGIASMYSLKGELIGHIGGSGTYAFYYPEKDLYFVGDVNQIKKVALVFRLPMNLAKLADKYYQA